METVTELDGTKAALVAYINKALWPYGIVVTPEQVHTEFYTYDDRCKWNCDIVTVDGYGVFGFTDGPLKEDVCESTPTPPGLHRH